MTDMKKLAMDVDAARSHLEFQLKGIRHASAHPIVREISNLIDARIALALATKAETPPYRQLLEELVEACDGEVEEVFSGEIGDAMRAARSALKQGVTDDEVAST